MYSDIFNGGILNLLGCKYYFKNLINILNTKYYY